LPRRILACGGRQLYHPALTRYLFGLARRERPRILFLPTASGDSADYLLTFYQQLGGADCHPAHLLLFDRTTDDPAEVIAGADIVMVGGGNTANMLAIWRLHGVEKALRDAYAAGTVMTGWSAGCLCWFECGITDSFTPELGPLRDGLAILAGSACPHYDDAERRPLAYRREIAAGLAPGIALDDGVAALYEDERLVEVVSGRSDGRAFRVSRGGEEPLPVRPLS
jgi:dipeptidase E